MTSVLYLAYSLNVYLHFTKLILHKVTLRSLIHRGLSDNPTQKKRLKFCFMFLSKTIHMYKANITLLYLMCAVEGQIFTIIRYFNLKIRKHILL